MTYKIHEEIKEDLRQAGRTMTELSMALGINYDSLNHYLNGRRELPGEMETKINETIAEWKDVQA